jgi:hypothetical protein
VIGVQRFEQQFSMGDGPFDLGQLRRAVQAALDHLALGHGRTAGCTALVEVRDVARETRVRVCSAALRCSQPSTRMVNGLPGALILQPEIVTWLVWERAKLASGQGGHR